MQAQARGTEGATTSGRGSSDGASPPAGGDDRSQLPENHWARSPTWRWRRPLTLEDLTPIASHLPHLAFPRFSRRFTARVEEGAPGAGSDDGRLMSTLRRVASSDLYKLFMLFMGITFLYANIGLLLSVSPVVGARMGSDALSSIPMCAEGVGRAIGGALIEPLAARLFGGRRRLSFTAFGLVGIGGSALAFHGVRIDSFGLYTGSLLFVGMSNGAGQFLRFIAADVVRPAFKNQALSLASVGGVAGAVLGPELAKVGANLFAVEFAGTFLPYLAALCLGQMLCCAMVCMTPHGKAPDAAPRASQPLVRLLREHADVALGMGACYTSWFTMVMLMAAVPLAVAPRYGFDASATIIQVHLALMFIPNLANGWLVDKLGAGALLLMGCGLIVAGCTLGLVPPLGDQLWGFQTTMWLYPVGWSWLFVTGSCLVSSKRLAAADRAVVRSVCEAGTYLLVAASTAVTGVLFTETGWLGLNALTIALVVAYGAAVAAAWRRVQARDPEEPPGAKKGEDKDVETGEAGGGAEHSRRRLSEDGPRRTASPA